MQRFSVRLIKANSYGSEATALPPDLVLTPLSWSASDRGGCRDASIEATGSAESLAYLCGWLGDRIEIYNAGGTCVWWGLLWDIEVQIGSVVVSMSMDNIYNRVAVTYPFQLPDGSEESRTTEWVQDDNSIARFGVRELLYGAPVSLSLAPEIVRDQLLARLSTPGEIISTELSNAYVARISGRGLWQKAASIYFTNVDGLEEFTDGSSTQVIGRHMISTAVKFGSFTADADPEDMEVAGATFLTAFVDGDSFHILGAANADNNGAWTIDSVESNTHLEITSSFVDENSGATVKISYGDLPSMDNIAMSFELETAWTCTHVAVRCRKLGEPTDNFRIGIYPDSSGVPGTVLTAHEVAGSTLFTELTWTEFEFATPIALSAGVTYWIGIRRTGSANLNDGYEVAVDEDLGYADGEAKLYNGTAWVARDPDADMSFRVIGKIDSSAQMAKAIAAVADFDEAIVAVDSNVPVMQYTVQEHTVAEELTELLNAGMSDGSRLIAYVAYEDNVIVDIAEVAGFGESNLLLGEDGKLRYAGGSLYPPGVLIFGRNVDINSILLLNGTGTRPARGPATYVQTSTYDATADRLTIASDGAIDPWAALTIRKG